MWWFRDLVSAEAEEYEGEMVNYKDPCC